MSSPATPATDRFRRAAAQLPYLPRALRLVWHATRSWTVASLVLLVAQGLLPVALLYLTRALVNRLVQAFAAHGDVAALRALLPPAALMAGVLLLQHVIQSALHFIRSVQSELVFDHVNSLIHRQSLAADLAFYETPDFFDHLHRARADAAYRPLELLDTLGNTLRDSLTLLAMAAVIFPYGGWLPFVLVLNTLPAFWVVLRHALRRHDWFVRVTPDQRRVSYYDWLMTAGEAAAELRLFALGGLFQSAYRTLRARLLGERVALARAEGLGELAAGAAALVVTAAALAFMAWRAILGYITVGDLALFYQAFQQGSSVMRGVLESMGRLYSNVLFLGNLFEFLDLQPGVVTPPSPQPVPVPLRQGIRFSGVQFRYPGTDALVLDNFDLFIPAGRCVAIVGPNGAGKSTLVNLLCRFYDPQAGAVTWDDTDLRAMSVAELRRCISVLFQRPMQYNATARENIAFGDVAAGPSLEAVQVAARAASIDTRLAQLPHSYDTLLGKQLANGVQLSVGEWHRVALARVLLRPAPIIVLDEPTGAMDPWAEAAWLAQFRKSIAGVTVIMITHRSTTARVADQIHVMDAGRIVESGTHPELIAHGGLYAQWWTSQGARQ